MKSYNDYSKEYENLTKTAKPDDFVVKKDIWISSKWQEDNDFSISKPNFHRDLQKLAKFDSKLADAVVIGIQFLLKSQMKNKDKDTEKAIDSLTNFRNWT